jgi:hypothetical protein
MRYAVMVTHGHHTRNPAGLRSHPAVEDGCAAVTLTASCVRALKRHVAGGPSSYCGTGWPLPEARSNASQSAEAKGVAYAPDLNPVEHV